MEYPLRIQRIEERARMLRATFLEPVVALGMRGVGRLVDLAFRTSGKRSNADYAADKDLVRALGPMSLDRFELRNN